MKLKKRLCLVLLALTGWLPALGNAAEIDCCSQQPACVAKTSGSWKICESANFRFCCKGSATAGQQTVLDAEALKAQLADKWLGGAAATVSPWAPKCDVILHTTLASYLRAVPGGEQTAGSSLIQPDRGKIVTRRIDVRADKPGWFSAALAHELTHVILADVFPGGRVPHWADEGMAVLADPISKQRAHLDDLHYAQSTRSTLRVVELLSLNGYPQPHQQATFYGQSASIVRFLLDRDSPAQFVKFVKFAENQGYEAALREHYRINGVHDLERRWAAYAQAARTKRELAVE